MTGPTDNLYLVHWSDYEAIPPGEGEYFWRAVVYAASPDEALRTVCDWIEFCNEAEEADPDADEDVGLIHYERDKLVATLLGENAQRPPEDSAFDADNILFFETEWA